MRKLYRDKDFLRNIRNADPKLYRLISILGAGSVSIGAAIYIDAVNDIRFDVSDMFFDLTCSKSLTRFFKETECSKHYKNSDSMRSALSKIVSRNYEKTMRFNCYYAQRKILKMYEEWRKNNER